MKCLVGYTDESLGFAIDSCSPFNILYIILYACTTAIILECVNRISSVDPKLMDYYLIGAVILSFCLLIIYDFLDSRRGSGLFYSHVLVTDFFSLGILIHGLILFSKDPQPDTDIYVIS